MQQQVIQKLRRMQVLSKANKQTYFKELFKQFYLMQQTYKTRIPLLSESPNNLGYSFQKDQAVVKILQKQSNFKFTETVKILRQTDQLSLADIDSILGNEPTQLQKKKENEQQIQKRQLFYNLVPVKNEHFPPCIDPDFVQLLETPNQNIMQALNITVESSFNDYCKAMSTFWREDELYGSTTPETKIEPQNIEFLPLLTVSYQNLSQTNQSLKLLFIIVDYLQNKESYWQIQMIINSTPVSYQRRFTIHLEQPPQSLMKLKIEEPSICTNDQEHIDSSTLLKDISLFSFYKKMHYLFSIDFLMDSLNIGFEKNNFDFKSHQQQLRTCLSNQFQEINHKLGQNCQKALQLLLIQSGISFKLKVETNQRTIENIKMEQKVLNHIYYFLKLNYQHKRLCDSQQNIFSFQEMAKIFYCDIKAIQYFNDIYCKNRLDIQQPFCVGKKLICQLFMIKLKLLISKKIRQGKELPTSQQTQKYLFGIRLYFMDQYNNVIINNKYKTRFSMMCMDEDKFFKLSFKKRNELLDEITSLAKSNLSSQKETEELQKLSSKFSVKYLFVCNEYKRIKFNKKPKINELFSKANELLELMNYQRWKSPQQTFKKVLEKFPFLGTPATLQGIIEQYCKPLLFNVKMIQRESSKNINRFMISQLNNSSEDVLFISYSIFYKQQLNDYNIIHNKSQLIQSSQAKFIPANDAYLCLITGITNKQVLFYSTIEETISISKYLKKVKQIFNKIKQALPQVIVFNVSMGWKGQQWQKLSNLRTYMENKGFLVFISFNQQYQNINFEIGRIIKQNIRTKLHSLFRYEKTKQLREKAKEIIHQFLNQTDLKPLIQKFLTQKHIWKFYSNNIIQILQ